MEINKIHNTDCLQFIKTLPDCSIDLVCTDPPYGIDYQSNQRTVSKKFDKLENDNNSSRLDVYSEFYRVLKDDCVAVVFCSFKNYAEDYFRLAELFDIKNVIVWNKGGGGIGDLVHSLSTDYELAIVSHKGMCPIRGKRDGSVWSEGKVNANTMLHPTEKPLEIIKRIVDKFSDEGQLVLDPFLGSGTTAVACKTMKRNYIGCEISKDYYEMAQKRIDSIPNMLF